MRLEKTIPRLELALSSHKAVSGCSFVLSIPWLVDTWYHRQSFIFFLRCLSILVGIEARHDPVSHHPLTSFCYNVQLYSFGIVDIVA